MKTIHSLNGLVRLLFVLTSCYAMSLSPSVYAATFTVDSTADTVDTMVGDGVCADVSGNCTLRAAIIEANALAGTNTIVFAPSVAPGPFTLSLVGRNEDAAATGDLDIIGDLVIKGAGLSETVLDGGGIDRVLHVLGESRVAISSVTVQNGDAGPTTSDNGGGILNRATLDLTNTTVTGNAANDGGGITNEGGKLTIHNSTISGNVAGPPAASGGGGAINNQNGILIITESTISDNFADDEGGGIQNDSGGSISMRNSTVSNNEAPNSHGGGFAIFSGTLTVTNTTITGNVTGAEGGGIWNNGALTMISSTLSQNSAGGSGGAISGTADVRNSIIADSPAGGDCSGAINSLDYNLDSDGTCSLTQPNDLPNTDPLLGPLSNNGGPTETHALLAGSPAIDAGEVVCTDADGAPLSTDQRGEPRPVDGNGDGITACDIGAFEVQMGLPYVAIDIKPWKDPSDPNTFDLRKQRKHRKFWVAILSSNNFDALQVKPKSVRFGRGKAKPLEYRVNDPNRDGFDDLLLRFRNGHAKFKCGDTEASLAGRTYAGEKVYGTDTIRTVNCK